MDSFRWADETGMLGLGGFPGTTHNNFANATSADGSIVVGYGQSLNGIEAYRWTAETGIVGLGVLPGAAWFQSFAEGISSDGSVIVGRSNSALGGEAYRWTAEGGMESLGTLPESNLSWAMATSSDGSVVVGFGNVDGFRVAFVWDPTSGMRSLRQILTDEGIDLTGWQLLEATDVSDDGRTVVGYGIDPAGRTQAWIAELPDVLDIAIDIKPGSDTNSINLRYAAIVPVAILGSEDFDVLTVDPNTVCFGLDPDDRSRSDCTESHDQGHFDKDVNDDGYLDLVMHFDNHRTWIGLGESEACLTGETLDGEHFHGCDTYRGIFKCGIGFELAFILPPLMWLRGRRRRSALT
jgi:probable HAF family extracellular repeat protein